MFLFQSHCVILILKWKNQLKYSLVKFRKFFQRSRKILQDLVCLDLPRSGIRYTLNKISARCQQNHQFIKILPKFNVNTKVLHNVFLQHHYLQYHKVSNRVKRGCFNLSVSNSSAAYFKMFKSFGTNFSLLTSKNINV